MVKTLVAAFLEGFADAVRLFAALVLAPPSVVNAFLHQDRAPRRQTSAPRKDGRERCPSLTSFPPSMAQHSYEAVQEPSQG